MRGLGQTSWGPTVFAFVRDEAAGNAVLEELRVSKLPAGAVQLVVPLNRGHVLQVGEASAATVRDPCADGIHS